MAKTIDEPSGERTRCRTSRLHQGIIQVGMTGRRQELQDLDEASPQDPQTCAKQKVPGIAEDEQHRHDHERQGAIDVDREDVVRAQPDRRNRHGNDGGKYTPGGALD